MAQSDEIGGDARGDGGRGAGERRGGTGWGASVREVGAALQSGVAPVASRVGSAVTRGVDSVGRALEDPAASALAGEVLRQSDLPELEAGAALQSLALRLDREADLWRGIAMRQLARASWMERIAVSTAVFAFGGTLLLGAIAAFRALFARGEEIGAGGGGSVALLLCVGALLIAAGGLLAHRVASRVRQGQIDVAREALARGDLAELRLHRLALVLELRGQDAEAYRGALRQLEGEIRAR